MTLKILYAPLVDGELNLDYGHCRKAQRFDETIIDDATGEEIVPLRFSIPGDRDESDFTVIDLGQADAEALAERVCARAAAGSGDEWGWEVSEWVDE